MKRALFWLALATLIYCATASTVYRFRYPEKTETELFLELWRAMLWQ